MVGKNDGHGLVAGSDYVEMEDGSEWKRFVEREDHAIVVDWEWVYFGCCSQCKGADVGLVQVESRKIGAVQDLAGYSEY